MNRLKTIKELLTTYKNGQRELDGWDFEENGSDQGSNLSGIIFKNCFFLNIINSNLSDTEFISCNIKTADFRGANLINCLIKNCSLESTMFKNAKVENFRFEENYCYGGTTGLNDFEGLFLKTGED